MDEIVSESETRSRHLSGRLKAIASLLAVGLSVYALYWVVAIVEPQIYRVSFLLISLVLTFLLYPARSTIRGLRGVHGARRGPDRRGGRVARLASG